MDKLAILAVEAGKEIMLTLVSMSPYLLLGFTVAGILSVLVSPETVERHLGGKGWKPVVKATLFGIPLPLCSCGVLPVAASLRKHGASRGSTMAFLLSTPETGVDSILVTYGLLGTVIAIFRPLAALVMGLTGGLLVDRFAASAEIAKEEPRHNGEECCSTESKGSWLRRALTHAFVTLPRDIAKPMLIGLVIAGLIGAAVPDDFFAGALGEGVTGILIMIVVGIPMYVCATASVPIAAVLILKGVSPGAALAFLIAGPATNAAAVAMIWKMMGPRATVTYLGTVAGAALGFGLLLDALFRIEGVKAAEVACHTELSWFGIACAAVLLAVFAFALLKRRSPASSAPASPIPLTLDTRTSSVVPLPLDTLTLSVGGMTCEHCAGTVKRALIGIPGVASVSVDLAGGRVVIAGRELRKESLTTAVEASGYHVTP